MLPGDLDLELVQSWLSELLQERGADMYRMKGVLSVAHAKQRFVYHAVHLPTSRHISPYLAISRHISPYLAKQRFVYHAVHMTFYISPYLATSRHISPYLATSRHISPHLATSRHISQVHMTFSGGFEEP